MFEKFPKTRPPLPKEVLETYSKLYLSNRQGLTPASSLSQKMESWLHRQVANDLQNVSGKRDIATLEIGAGTLNQLQFEPEIGPYDVVEPFTELYAHADSKTRVRAFYADISEIPKQMLYDRITSVATFEHICNLPHVIARCGMHLKESGKLRVSIPSEGTILWGLGWRLTTGLEFRIKYGIDYGLIMRHEHVNTSKEIEEALNYFFKNVEYKVFGLNKYFSLYQYYECGSPDMEKCLDFLEK